MNTTNQLLNNVVAMNTWRAIRNASGPAPTWELWLVTILTAVVVIVCGVMLWDLFKDDIEYYFWEKKYSKKNKKRG